ncbi:MAG: YbhB/YbcL family Raf kinase inhibitor-like protein [Syntrophales bacterium]|nr:YbhB/YbcL family Raf kinase inhibitor-like protein [Syntrophales bacterium]
MIRKLFLMAILVFLLTFLSLDGTQAQMKGGKTMEIKSTAFKEGGMIPAKYTCDGVDVSPPLEWSNFPKETKSFALICDDPDAPMGTWVHWVIYDIPAGITQLPENVAPQRELASGGKQGTNDFRKIGYGGPCPPRGEHRYYFKLYALDGATDLKPGATKEQLLKAMKGHILAEAQLMGKYKR